MKSIKSTPYITIGMRVVVVLSLLITAGQSFAQKVSVDFDKDIDFSKYKTYAFAAGTPTPVTLTNQRIEKAIEAQLAAKGLTRVESNADLTVVFHCAVTEQTQLNTTSLDGWGWGPGWGWGSGWGWGRWGGGGGTAITQVERIPVGTLIVDIGDLSTKKYIWRGTASKTISSNPAKNAKAIDPAVKKMFEKFPPREGGKDRSPHDRGRPLRAGLQSRRDQMFIESGSQRTLKLRRGEIFGFLKGTLRSYGAKQLFPAPRPINIWSLRTQG